jgi:shikimate kinase
MNNNEKATPDWENVKQVMKAWILRITEVDKMPEKIEGLYFGIFEGAHQYQVNLTGSYFYDPEDDDWACEEDFVPQERYCPGIGLELSYHWEEILSGMVSVLGEIVAELTSLPLFQVKHITTGFDDGEIVAIT